MAPLLVSGCGGGEGPASPPPTTDGSEVREVPARNRLAALAAAAADRRFTAAYRLSVTDRADRTVTVALADDGTWRLDVSGGAADGRSDVAVVRTADGLYECEPAQVDSPIGPSCVRVAGPDGALPADAVLWVHHLFTDWVHALSDRQAPLAVSDGEPLPGAAGSCFAVESTSASLEPPLAVGTYCYAADGTLTGARVTSGTLVLAGAPLPAPDTVSLPGPVVVGAPFGSVPPTAAAPADPPVSPR
ncbi:MAG TPA: hypothetical protein VF174_16960 [Micromonosporaceae bacterium]